MVHLFIGALFMAGFLFLTNFAHRRKIHVTWWQWILTILCFIYTVFVLEMIVSFIDEGSARGALVMGLIMGLVAIIWGVLLGRFVFIRSTKY